MKTKPIYYEDPYKTEIKAVVLEIQESGGSLMANIILDQTIFYPESGGQPGDQGEIIGEEGVAKVTSTRIINGEIIHQGKTNGHLAPNDKVTAKLNQAFRLKYMKIHSAGHLIHDVLMTMVSGLTPLKGSHGSKAFLEYSGSLDVSLKDELEKKVNEAASGDLPIVTSKASYDELVSLCQFVPPNLSKDKLLRMIKIGNYKPMPDGGVHLKSTKEIGQIIISEILSANGLAIIKYRVLGT